MTDTPEHCRDFDFEIGTWHVRHRRLRERLTGCTDWESFEGTAEMRPVLGGNGNIEDNLLHFPGGSYRAIAIRSYDTQSRNWAIWWLATDDPHRIDVPVIGRFENGTGTFIARETLRDQPILVRFLWLHTETATPRWEQAMSPDEGQSWETNWTMDFRRA
ncbi:DUF1579 domain-containing protein [Marimonas sp. MJW-29]|uniref:DUF1579 domain-containing protein n=1 Tax=Sulfitobacter sediminis TaxID=3234186 RepID=A0ABV3RLK7_9RHOB